MSTIDLEIRQKLEKLYEIFETRMAKILSGHTKAQRELGPLSKRDQAVVDDYKDFLRIKRKYNGEFYDDMFTHWSRAIDAPEFIFDEPIEFEINRNHFFINLPVIHEWGLRNSETKGFVAELEKVLISIVSIFHPDEVMSSKFKNRLRELSPQSKVPSGLPQGNPLQGDALKNMMGNMLNGIKNMPMFKEQLPEDFDGTEFTNAVLGSETMTSMMKDIQSGNFNMEKLGSITEDPSLKAVFEKLGDVENKPTSFADLPKELQPPGEPADASTSTPAVEEKTPNNDLALFSKASVNEFVTGGHEFKEKEKEPMVPQQEKERTMEID